MPLARPWQRARLEIGRQFLRNLVSSPALGIIVITLAQAAAAASGELTKESLAEANSDHLINVLLE